ncbi:YbhN family protein [Ureaplasma miroungigenitalium]|uniref:YbhN family protein n=1 Tax=Ureaplasma miroungigenitalium TaxID=1042321 RepID=A0ABT3BLT9_9BACT|nr:YbhN family protein [Ureaplasma miroungigenitalium]MCV3728231.1 YbhN family protein [Ureaplasma miroungigenitalium]MCV3734035.1 YbhN family protein [Ureaplasma miroungigenitalium]
MSISFVLKIDFKTLHQTLELWANQQDYFGWYICLLLMFCFFRAIIFVLVVRWHAQKVKVKLPFYHYLGLGFIIIFLSNITPFSIGSEPYVIYFINKYIFKNLKQASAFWLVNNTFVQVAQVLITWPSFFYITHQYLQNKHTDSNFNFPYHYWLSLAGLLLDVVVTGLYFVLAFSKKIHIAFHRIVLFIKRLLKIQKQKPLNLNTNFYWYVHYYYKEAWLIFMGLLVGFVYNFCLYALIFIVFLCSSKTAPSAYHFFNWYNITNVAVTATNFVPIPGSEGGIQFILKTLLQAYENRSNLEQKNIDIIVFLWRFFSAYTGTLIGLGVFLIYFPLHMVQYYRQAKRHQRKLFRFNF